MLTFTTSVQHVAPAGQKMRERPLVILIPALTLHALLPITVLSEFIDLGLPYFGLLKLILRHVHRPRQRTVRVSLIVIRFCLSVCLSVWMSAGRASGGACRPRQRTVLLLRSSRCCCCVAAPCCCVAAVRSRRDSGSRQTLLFLQFLTEFANIWAQYSPSTYASTHVGFF